MTWKEATGSAPAAIKINPNAMGALCRRRLEAICGIL